MTEVSLDQMRAEILKKQQQIHALQEEVKELQQRFVRVVGTIAGDDFNMEVPTTASPRRARWNPVAFCKFIEANEISKEELESKMTQEKPEASLANMEKYVKQYTRVVKGVLVLNSEGQRVAKGPNAKS